jgi:hypothetical protein
MLKIIRRENSPMTVKTIIANTELNPHERGEPRKNPSRPPEVWIAPKSNPWTAPILALSTMEQTDHPKRKQPERTLGFPEFSPE